MVRSGGVHCCGSAFCAADDCTQQAPSCASQALRARGRVMESGRPSAARILFDATASLRPVAVFEIAVGRRNKFKCFVRHEFNGSTLLLDLIFEVCGLESWGWSLDRIHLRRLSTDVAGTLWQVERT